MSTKHPSSILYGGNALFLGGELYSVKSRVPVEQRILKSAIEENAYLSVLGTSLVYRSLVNASLGNKIISLSTELCGVSSVILIY